MSYVVQGTGAWLAARCGRLTASRMADATARLKTGGWAKSRRDLMIELIAERMTGISAEHYTSAEMRHGIETEPVAKAEYEELTGNLLVPAPFVEHPTIEYLGATPDAFQGRDTCVEFKCPKTATHLGYLRGGDVPEAYRPQILTQLACTRRPHAVFVSFDPRIHGPQRLFIREWTPDPAEIVAIEAMAREFLDELEAEFEAITSAA